MSGVLDRRSALRREVEKCVRGRCARGSCGRDDEALVGNSFSDAPSFPRAKSIQQSRSATRKEKNNKRKIKERHAPAGIGCQSHTRTNALPNATS